MRPVNLIPVDDRRDGRGQTRTGVLPYLLVAALVGVLVGVTALVLVGNQISDRKAEVARLKQEDAAATARAERLAAYTQFRALQEQRLETVTSLADSRFDWERVMRELSLILPHDVWLVNLEATASPEASGAGGGESEGGSGLRAAASGPALKINGCAGGQEAVAGFVAALKDIDGVTRVGLQSSELPEQSEVAGTSGAGSGGEDCRTRAFIPKFEIVVAFDAAPVPPSTLATEVAAAPPAETTEASSTESTEGG